MIHFTCPFCGKSLKAKDEFAGRKGRCTGCDRVYAIPTAETELVLKQAYFLSLLHDFSALGKVRTTLRTGPPLRSVSSGSRSLVAFCSFLHVAFGVLADRDIQIPTS